MSLAFDHIGGWSIRRSHDLLSLPQKQLFRSAIRSCWSTPSSVIPPLVLIFRSSWYVLTPHSFLNSLGADQLTEPSPTASERVRRTPAKIARRFPPNTFSTRYIERWQKQHGKRLDHDERVRKRQAREGHKQSYDAQNLRGLRAKLYQQKRHKEKIQMKKRIKAQEEKNVKSAAPDEPSKTPLPQYLLDRSQATNAKALSSAIKDKRKEKAAKFAVPLPKVKGISEEEMFKVVNTGKKTHQKSWKRMITKPTFVGNDFTRRPVKYERFIRPMGLRYKKANVTQYV